MRKPKNLEISCLNSTAGQKNSHTKSLIIEISSYIKSAK